MMLGDVGPRYAVVRALLSGLRPPDYKEEVEQTVDLRGISSDCTGCWRLRPK